MMVTSSTETSATPQKTAGSTLSPRDTMGKDQFLKLLIEQIKHQDPLSPMENTEFTSQMAQFSTLEQLYNVNTNLGQIANINAATNSTQALGMIGKEVKAAGDSIDLAGGKTSGVNFILPHDAATVNVQIMNASGELVASIDAGAREAGDNLLAWDGRNTAGEALASGTYTFNVEARTLTGDLIETQTFMRGIVKSVSMANGVTYLHIGNSKIQLGDVMEAGQPGAGASAAEKN